MSLLLLLVGCVDPVDTVSDPGTQIGDEGDDRVCVEVREELSELDVAYGDLEMTAQAFLDVAETPVSGSMPFPGGPVTMTLSLEHTGRIWYAHDEPRDDEVDGSECTAQSYFAEVSGHVAAGDLIDESFETEAWGFQAGHAWVGPRFAYADLTGTLEPTQLDPEAWETFELSVFGGSTDGVWTMHVDWEARSTGSYDQESVADGTLSP